MLVADRLARECLRHEGGRLAPAHLAQHAVREAELAVRARANAEVIAELPVVQVVRAAVALARIGRHLVARQAAGAGALGDQVQHVAGQVGVRQAGGRSGREHRVGLDGQVVDGQVRRLEAQRRVQLARQVVQRLPRQRVHQVEVEGVEGRGRLGQRLARLAGAVNATEPLQLRVVEALHAHRQPRDAGLPEALEALALEGAGVGLQRDLAAGLQRQAGAHVGDQLADLLGVEQAGRAATDEDADDGPTPHQRQRGLQVGAQRGEVGLRGVGGQRAILHFMRVEVAIRAFAQAPGQVHVQRQGRQRRQLQRARAHQVLQVGHGSHPRCQTSRNCAISWAAASARWLCWFLTAAGRLATVWPSAGMCISGS